MEVPEPLPWENMNEAIYSFLQCFPPLPKTSDTGF